MSRFGPRINNLYPPPHIRLTNPCLLITYSLTPRASRVSHPSYHPILLSLARHYTPAALDRPMPTDDEIPFIDRARLRWNTTDLLGEGSFGIVYRGLYNGVPVAIKVVKRPQTNSANPTEEQQQQELAAMKQHRREIHRFRAVQNPYIIQYCGVFRDQDPRDLYIVTEYLEGGSLHDSLVAMRARGAILETRSFLQIALHIAYGLNHVHYMGYTHGDMKPQNVLLTSALEFTQHERGMTAHIAKSAKVKIADFGLSKRLKSADGPPGIFGASTTGTSEFSSGPCGTFLYMAPEVYRDFSSLNDDQVKSSDVYAYGLILFELLACLQSWQLERVQNPLQLYQLVIEQKRPSWGPQKPFLDPHHTQLVERCWSHDCDSRPTVDEIITILTQFEDDYKRSANASDSSSSVPTTPPSSKSSQAQHAQPQPEPQPQLQPQPQHQLNPQQKEHPQSQPQLSPQLPPQPQYEPNGATPRARKRSPKRSPALSPLQNQPFHNTPRLPHLHQRTNQAQSNNIPPADIAPQSPEDEVGGTSPRHMRLQLPTHPPESSFSQNEATSQPESSWGYEIGPAPDDEEYEDFADEYGLAVAPPRNEVDVPISQEDEEAAFRHVESALPLTESQTKTILMSARPRPLDMPNFPDADSEDEEAVIRNSGDGSEPRDALSNISLAIPVKSINAEGGAAEMKSAASSESGRTQSGDREEVDLDGSKIGEIPVKHVDSKPILGPQLELPGAKICSEGQPKRSDSSYFNSFYNAFNPTHGAGPVPQNQYGDVDNISQVAPAQAMVNAPPSQVPRITAPPAGSLQPPSLAVPPPGAGAYSGDIVSQKLAVDGVGLNLNQIMGQAPGGGHNVGNADGVTGPSGFAPENLDVGHDGRKYGSGAAAQYNPETRPSQNMPNHSGDGIVAVAPSRYSCPPLNTGDEDQLAQFFANTDLNSHMPTTGAHGPTRVMNGAQNPSLNNGIPSVGGVANSSRIDGNANGNHQGYGPGDYVNHGSSGRIMRDGFGAVGPVSQGFYASMKSSHMMHAGDIGRPGHDRLQHALGPMGPHGQMISNALRVDTHYVVTMLEQAVTNKVSFVWQLWNEGHRWAVSSGLAKYNRADGEELLKSCCQMLEDIERSEMGRHYFDQAKDLLTTIGNIGRNSGRSISKETVEWALQVIWKSIERMYSQQASQMNVFSACNYALCNLLKINNNISDVNLRLRLIWWLVWILSWSFQSASSGALQRWDVVSYTATCAARNFLWMNETNVTAFVGHTHAYSYAPISLLVSTTRFADYTNDLLLVTSSMSALAVIIHFPMHRLDFVQKDGMECVIQVLKRHIRNEKIANLSFSMMSVLFSGPCATMEEMSILSNAFVRRRFAQEMRATLDISVQHGQRPQRPELLESGFNAVLAGCRFSPDVMRSFADADMPRLVVTTLRIVISASRQSVGMASHTADCWRRVGLVLVEIIREFCKDQGLVHYMRGERVGRWLDELGQMDKGCESIVRGCLTVLPAY